MSQVYVPWRERDKPRLNPLAKLAVVIGKIFYTVFTPILSHFAGFIMLGAMFVSILAVWGVATFVLALKLFRWQ